MMNSGIKDRLKARKELGRQQISLFVACWSLWLPVCSPLAPGALQQSLCSFPSHFTQSPTHFHSQHEFPIKNTSLHINRAGAPFVLGPDPYASLAP